VCERERELLNVHIPTTNKLVLGVGELHSMRGVPLRCFLSSILLKKIDRV